MSTNQGNEEPNPSGRRLAIIAAAGAAIIIATVVTACGGGGNDNKKTIGAETRTTPAAQSTASTEAEPKSLAFHRNDGATPGAGTGQSSSSTTATPTPSRAAATPTKTPTPARTKATATATPGSSSSSSDSDPGGLTSFGGIDSYKFIVHKEYTGVVASEKWDQYQDAFSDYDSLFPGSKPTGDKTFVVDVTGTYISPDRFQTTTKLGGSSKLTDTIVENKWASQLDTGKPDTGTLKDDFDQDDFSEAAAIWDNGFLSWLDDADGITMSCHSISDKINGMPARDCVLSQPSKNDLFDLIDAFGGSSIQHNDSTTLEFWLMAKQNIPLRFKLNITGKDKDGKATRISVTSDLTDVNSKALKVELPK